MTPTPEVITSLIEKVEAGSGSDSVLNAEIACAFVFTDKRPSQPDDFDGKYGYTPGYIKCENDFLLASNYSGSIDAAVALTEKLLPGWHWLVRSPSKDAKNTEAFFSRVESPDYESVTWGKGENWITDHMSGFDGISYAPTAPRALLAKMTDQTKSNRGGDDQR